MTGFAKNVHIACLGFEVERIVAPFTESKGDKLYLIVRTDSAATGQKEEIQKKIGAKNIVILETDADDVYTQIRTARQAMKAEPDANLFLNLSTGSKLNAMALFLAAQYSPELGRSQTAYYAEMECYASQNIEQAKKRKPFEETWDYIQSKIIPIYALPRPTTEQIRLLSQIGDGIRKPDLLKWATREGLISEPKPDQTARNAAAYMTLRKKFLEPLENQWRAIEEDGKRNKMVKLTEEGKALKTMLE